MAELDKRSGELLTLEIRLRNTIKEARRAKTELESAIAVSKRRQRGGW
jgi:hypothetical protein